MLAGPRDQVPTAGATTSSVADDAGSSEPTAPEPLPPAEPTTTEDPPMSPTATTAPQQPAEPDGLAAATVETARAAALAEAGSTVGEHLGAEAEDEHTLTHSFACTVAGYVGWRWAVTVVRVEGSDAVTVDEVVLLPGSGALLAPAWVPWSERIRPGDLSPGDLLPPEPDDPRLVPSYGDVDAAELPFALHRELGLGRVRVLSRDGRADAAERWYDGDAGPSTPMAKAAPADCGSCGFLVPLAGALGRVFGACANGMANDDGRVVARTHGCGAHSETVVENVESTYSGMAVEDDEFEVVDRQRVVADPVDVAGEEVLPGSDAVGIEVEVEVPPVEPSPVEPSAAEPSAAESSPVEPSLDEPSSVEPSPGSSVDPATLAADGVAGIPATTEDDPAGAALAGGLTDEPAAAGSSADVDPLESGLVGGLTGPVED